MSCKFPGKIKHPTEQEAREHIRALYKAGKGNPDYLPYPCDGGRHWHVGHSQQRLGERIRQATKLGNGRAARARRIGRRR